MEKTYRILMLEDVASDAELAERALKSDGIAFISRRVDTESAFESALDEFAPDLILVDYNLPQYNGMVALERVKSRGIAAPVIFHTGIVGDQLAVEAMKKGAVDFVLKGSLPMLAPAVKRALQEVEQAVAAKEADLLKNKFIQVVSHQFRTPLNAIRWNLETLLSGEIDIPPEARSMVRNSYEADIEVISRISDLLTAMDIVEGRIAIEADDVSLESIVKTTFEEAKKRCAVKGLTCELQLPPESLPSVKADASKIRIIVEKLIGNAIDYTGQGAVSVALERVGQSCRLTVTDTGVGIPEAEQKRIFTRFFRSSNATKLMPDGSGLGLYIAKNLVDRHGGAISFSSVENTGSKFWVDLPISN